MMNIYNYFHGYMAMNKHDKIFSSSIYSDAKGDLFLNIWISPRTLTSPGPSISHSNDDMLASMLSRRFEEWDAYDFEAALAICAATKCFNERSDEAQQSGLYETYHLGYAVKATEKDTLNSQSVSINRVIKSKIPLNNDVEIAKAIDDFTNLTFDQAPIEKAMSAFKICAQAASSGIQISKKWIKSILPPNLASICMGMNESSPEEIKKAFEHAFIKKHVPKELDYIFSGYNLGGCPEKEWETL